MHTHSPLGRVKAKKRGASGITNCHKESDCNNTISIKEFIRRKRRRHSRIEIIIHPSIGASGNVTSGLSHLQFRSLATMGPNVAGQTGHLPRWSERKESTQGTKRREETHLGLTLALCQKGESSYGLTRTSFSGGSACHSMWHVVHTQLQQATHTGHSHWDTRWTHNEQVYIQVILDHGSSMRISVTVTARDLRFGHLLSWGRVKGPRVKSEKSQGILVSINSCIDVLYLVSLSWTPRALSSYSWPSRLIL